MSYTVSISERAKQNLEQVIDYLEANWSDKVLSDFLRKLHEQTELLKQNPFMYAASEAKPDIRKCLITKHNAMYYRILNDEIQIITIHDTRSNPNSLKL